MSEALPAPSPSDATTGSVDEDNEHAILFLEETPERRAVPAAQITQLNETYLYIVKLMTEGFDESGHYIKGKRIEPHIPLTLTEAAQATHQRLKRAREMFRDCKAFQTALNAANVALRRAEAPRNLLTAIEIRDERGDNTAADRAVRLKAIASIEGRDGQGVNVNVQVNSQTNVAPGYVYKVPEHLAQHTAAPILDAQPIEPTE